jgi:hypothetical protein
VPVLLAAGGVAMPAGAFAENGQTDLAHRVADATSIEEKPTDGDPWAFLG